MPMFKSEDLPTRHFPASAGRFLVDLVAKLPERGWERVLWKRIEIIFGLLLYVAIMFCYTVTPPLSQSEASQPARRGTLCKSVIGHFLSPFQVFQPSRDQTIRQGGLGRNIKPICRIFVSKGSAQVAGFKPSHILKVAGPEDPTKSSTTIFCELISMRFPFWKLKRKPMDCCWNPKGRPFIDDADLPAAVPIPFLLPKAPFFATSQVWSETPPVIFVDWITLHSTVATENPLCIHIYT